MLSKLWELDSVSTGAFRIPYETPQLPAELEVVVIVMFIVHSSTVSFHMTVYSSTVDCRPIRQQKSRTVELIGSPTRQFRTVKLIGSPTRQFYCTKNLRKNSQSSPSLGLIFSESETSSPVLPE